MFFLVKRILLIIEGRKTSSQDNWTSATEIDPFSLVCSRVLFTGEMTREVYLKCS